MLDPSAVGKSVGPVRQRWDSRDCLLYALGVGAGAADPLAELDLTTEMAGDRPRQVLPTYPVVVGARLREIYQALGEIDWTKVVHARQRVEVAGPLPVEGDVQMTTEVTGIYDKTSAALVELTATACTPDSGDEVFRTRSTLFVRGAGGWGGDRGPATESLIPEREPDAVVTMKTRPDQALLYRLSGDLNPLHCDPAFASRAGFDRPILHGLCTYGFTGRALLHELCGSDAASFRVMDAKFSRPVLPGSQLHVQMWKLGAGHAVFRTFDGEGQAVLDAGEFHYGNGEPD